MIRSLCVRLVLLGNLAVFLIALNSLAHGMAEPGHAEGPALPLCPVPAAGVIAHRTIPSTIEWEGREYEASEGIEILMRVITDDRTDPEKRASAFAGLGTVAPRLQDTDHIPELVALYERLTQQDEKRAVIGCVAESNDRRGLPLFTKVLLDATDESDRFQAAYALAHCNVRQGVRALIDLSQSHELERERPGMRDAIVKVLQALNREKRWGRPDLDILQRINNGEIQWTEAEKLSQYIAELKKWFLENEHRFPGWELGDPLPEVENADEAVVTAPNED